MVQIETMDDVAIFTKELVAEGVNIHPDDDFRDMFNRETEEPTYTDAEADTRNSLMEHCFQVCEQNSIDIYDFMLEIYLTETGLNKYIPLPSSVN